MSPLEDLLIDDTNLDQELLASGLKGYVGVTQAGEVRSLERWEELSSKGKVVAMLLGLRAAELLGRRETGPSSPSEIAAMSGIASGTVKPVLRDLVVERLAHQPVPGKYAVSGHSLRRALEVMTAGRRA